jgi:1,4-alpha-glucan branching enzyme
MIQKTYFKTKDYCKVKFTLKPGSAQKVAIAGLNGNWNAPVLMSRKKDGTFSCELSLPKNTEHQFKYLVDETEWINDPEADDQLENTYGTTNSVIVL